MPKAKKLPSGNWRVRVFTHTDAEGKSHYKSFTAPSKKEAEFLALEYSNQKQLTQGNLNMTLKEAFDKYIESKVNILSPSTINTYDQQSRCYLQDIMPLKLSELTDELIQKSLSHEASYLSAKTVHNISGLLSKVLKEYFKTYKYQPSLPQKQKSNIYIPTEEEVKRLMEYTKQRNEKVYIPLLIIVCFGLRRSEICGLKWKDINFENQTMHIERALVKGRNRKDYEKTTKSYAGTRTLPMPDYLTQALKEAKEHALSEQVTTMTGAAIYNRFKRCLKELGIPHFRLHDLRHYNASVMLAMNIPNKYAAARMGHSTEEMLKKVYQHIMENKKTETDLQMMNYFDDFLKT
jgi:integrase